MELFLLSSTELLNTRCKNVLTKILIPDSHGLFFSFSFASAPFLALSLNLSELRFATNCSGKSHIFVDRPVPNFFCVEVGVA